MFSTRINELITTLGENETIRLLEGANKNRGKVLTIIVDQTMHRIPSEQVVGEAFEFTNGSFSTSTSEEIQKYIVICLKLLAKKLKSDDWESVRVIVSGHAILSMYIKLLVYRILHIETEDIAYFGKDGYRSIQIDIRNEVVAD